MRSIHGHPEDAAAGCIARHFGFMPDGSFP